MPVSDKDNEGWSFFHIVISADKDEILKALLAKGMQVCCQTKWLYSPVLCSLKTRLLSCY
jgi:hypothetical protein